MTINTPNFFQLDATGKQALAQQWHALTAPFEAPETVRTSVLAELLRCYDTYGRHYHNSSHLAALLRWAERYESELGNPAVVRLAVWFHDVIYESRRHDNETRSAAYAAQALAQLNVPASVADDVQVLICATQKHTTDPFIEQLNGASNDLCWFLDFDLAILGSRSEVYAAYAAAIRREYRWVPAFFYRKGRRAVLANFQARPQLYLTETMRSQLEQQARQNLSHELNDLA